MFRSLAARLTATYVFAAIVLVLIVVAAVLQLSLSMFAINSRDAMKSAASHTPFEAQLALARSGTLRAAAPSLLRQLAQPGLIIHLYMIEPSGRSFHARVGSDVGKDGSPIVAMHESLHRRNFGPRAFGPGGPPPFGGAPPPEGSRPDFEERAHDPLGLNYILHIEPRFVEVPNGHIVIAPDLAALAAKLNGFLIAMIPIGIFAVVAAWLLGRFITGQALRPLVETTASLDRFGAGDFTPRPVVTLERNEIGELAKAYNRAAAQVTAAFEERRLAETYMRQFIADAGHELRTPLTVIMGFVDVLRRRMPDDGTAKIYETILEESRRMKALIDKLIVLARLENLTEQKLETVDLGEVASHVITTLQALDAVPRIVFRAEPNTLVRGEEADLRDALSNLVENALKYAPESTVTVNVRSDGAAAVVEVIDRGPGIPSEEHERVFSRFYRGRERGETDGFGLGLAIAKRAVERMGGTISLESDPGAGCAFSIRLPRAVRGEAAALAV